MPTTGLLHGRAVPEGQPAAAAWVRQGLGRTATSPWWEARRRTPTFAGGADRVRYSVDVAGGEGPFTVDVELRFQSIGFRWAQNLKVYDAPEPQRFVRYYESMSTVSSEILARASAIAR